MQWSKLKSRVKSFVCPELQDVIDFHVTQYRRAHSWISESWITINGERVFDCGSRTYFMASRLELGRRIQAKEATAWEIVKNTLAEQEIHEPEEMGSAMREYLDLSIEEAICSTNPFIKALAIVDRRIGKRRLKELEIDDDEHSLVKAFYDLRRVS
jgi:hypothetical protein